MMSYVLSCCSTADLSKQHFEQRDIHYVCFHYVLDGVEHLDDLGQSVSFPDFYTALANGSSATTSQVNAIEYYSYFRRFLEQGQDVLHVCLSSGISGTINSARIAQENLDEEFPQRKLYIVDSLGASSGYGLLMDKLADLRDEGTNVVDAYHFAVENRLKVHHWFFSTDLSFYVKGGRISKSSYVVGTALGICPLLNMDSLGRLVPRDRIRTKKRVIQQMVEQMVRHAEGGTDYRGKVFLSNSACPEDAREVADLVKQKFPNIDGEPLINNVGTVIGSHTGPGTVALFFWGDERED